MPIIAVDDDVRSFLVACLLANLNCLALDFTVRQKVAISINFFVANQFCVLPPGRYTTTLLDTIVPRVVELTYTAWDLLPFARDILAEAGVATWNRWFPHNPVKENSDPAPFTWQEERRAHLRAELDAVYAHLYGLTREELEYVLDTFPIVRRKDEAKWGEFRTKRLVLEAFARHGF